MGEAKRRQQAAERNVKSMDPATGEIRPARYAGDSAVWRRRFARTAQLPGLEEGV
jgi:hypothetical protein